MPRNSFRDDIAALSARKGLTRPPRILFAAAERGLFSKPEGLTDGLEALPRFLRRLGSEVCVVLPYYGDIKAARSCETRHLFSFEIKLGWRTKFVGVKELELDRLRIWFIENDEYFGSPRNSSECERFAFFAKAVLEALSRLDFRPDIIHCIDRQTGMLPFLLRTQYHNSPLASSEVLFTLRNISEKGLCDFSLVSELLSVPEGSFGLLERFGQADFIKAGCIMSERLSTLSPTYAAEIRTPEFSEGLDSVLSFREDIIGIVNGIDRGVWNPGKDRFLPVTYAPNRILGKLQCKTALLEELGMQIKPHRPLIGMITRLSEEAGIGLVTEALDGLLSAFDCSFVLLGSGEASYEQWFREAEARWEGRVCVRPGYDEPLAHRLFAGCDFFLMPSRSEPCGTGQLISMAYGTLPIVRETGGLKDTVIPFGSSVGTGTGFSFRRFDSAAMSGAVALALDTYRDRPTMANLIRNAMETDFSCDRQAFEYTKLYIDMMK